MSTSIRTVLLVLVLIVYGIGYTCLDRNIQGQQIKIQQVPPLKVLQTITGYFKQISSQIFFVQTSVFLGGLKPETNKKEYESVLAYNLRTMTSLYPEFIDPYYFTNSFLAPISKYGAKQASLIFDTGIKANPNDLNLRFFYGANFFYNLQQPQKAAEAFEKTAKLENAPPIFSHLAAIFSAHGGNLQAGLIILQTMLKAEKEDIVRERYLEEIACFENAITIQNAVDLYTQKHGSPPKHLHQLVPKYLNDIPKIEKRFILHYTPPTVSLKRPESCDVVEKK